MSKPHSFMDNFLFLLGMTAIMAILYGIFCLAFIVDKVTIDDGSKVVQENTQQMDYDSIQSNLRQEEDFYVPDASSSGVPRN